MTHFRGFKTKQAAQQFINKNGGGSICYEKSDIEPRGKSPQEYRDCVKFGGLSREYPYAVMWN